MLSAPRHLPQSGTVTEFRSPILIAHRGFPGLRHEHTRSSYDLAIDSGADYIEPDIVATKDGHLVVRHENEIDGTTDVVEHPEFADRKTTKTIDDVEKTGWFTEDFTLAEIRTLRTRERIPDVRPHNAELSGEQVLTFDEVIQIAEEGAGRRGSPVGIYVETKHPTYFEGIGLNLNDLLIDALERHAPLRGLAHDLVAHVAHRAGDKQRHVSVPTWLLGYAPNPNQRHGVSQRIFLRSAGSGTRLSNSLSSGP